jgi:dolichol-phosphate mannosyltransferase
VTPAAASDAADPAWPSLAVVVPVFNEEAGIRRACEAIVGVMERYPGRSGVIAVNDASTDGSAVILSDLSEQLEMLLVCTHEKNRGYGGALRTGAAHAADDGFAYVAFIDSDLTNPPEDLMKIGELARQGHSYIKGSRFSSGGDMSAVPFRRRIFSETGNLVGRWLFGVKIRDVTNGFRGVRTDLYLSWPLRERGFPVIVEELDWALRSGVEPVEFPTVLSVRGEGQRPSSFPYRPRLIVTYLRYPLYARMRRFSRGFRGRR